MKSESLIWHNRYWITLLIIVLIFGIAIGEGFGNLTFSNQVNQLRQEVQSLQLETQTSQPNSNTTYITYQTGGNISIPQLYQSVKNSVVIITGIVTAQSFFGTLYEEVQGSGFVYNLTGRMVIITNFHVIDGAFNITVTFTDGNMYAATVLGSDPYADLAVLSAAASNSELKAIPVVSSTDLQVGDSVIAIGNPYGLSGSVTTGIISQLGRTITEGTTGGYSIADVIQISAAINPGNSGGPLLNYLGQVIGITTATVSGSQGLGLAIPSSTILKEVSSLANTGSYTDHSWMGVNTTDMSYYIAQAMGVNVTYGCLIQSITSGSPAEQVGLHVGNQVVQIMGSNVVLGGDLIIGINGTRILNGDDLSSYLEQYTFPSQTIEINILRNGQVMNIPLTLATRPPPS
ncbi:MAG: trypsin-like peptidase domain-containing protein [Nitrososphaeria archaeon]